MTSKRLASRDWSPSLLADAAVAPERLILEVAETALAGDGETVTRAVRELATYGIGVAVANFGASPARLSQLRGLAVSEIKIDRTLVSGTPHDHLDRAVVRSVIEVGHSLGCRVTAEGVETPLVRRWLAGAGCDDAQGYLFSRPVAWPSVLDRYIATDRDRHVLPQLILPEPGAEAPGTADHDNPVPQVG